MNSTSKHTGFSNTNYSNSVNLNSDHKYENEEDSVHRNPTASWRQALQQAMLVFVTNLHSLSVGIALAFPTVVISHLRSLNGIWTLQGEKFKIFLGTKDEDNEISYDDEQASWHGSLAVTSILLGSLVASAVQPRFGRRTVLNVANIFLVTAWSLSSVAQQPALILASSSLTSFYAGTLIAPILVYQNETLPPRLLRSTFLLPANHVSFMLGMVIEMALGAVIYWRTIAAINTIFPGICILIVLALSKSHSSLQQHKQSIKSFPPNTEIKVTNCSLQDGNGYKHKVGDVTKVTIPQSTQPSQGKPSKFHSIALLTALLCFHHLCGITAIRTYSTSLLGMLSAYELPTYIHIFPFILACTQISGVCFGLALRGWSGRSCKIPLLLASYVGSTGSCLALGFYSHFHVHKSTIPHPNVKITSAIPAWLPSVLLGIHSFASCMSIPLLPDSLAGEFLPSFSLGLASRFALFFSCITCFLGNKFFFSIVQAVGVRGFFWIYSVTGFLCSALIYTLLPRNADDNGKASTTSVWHHMGEEQIDTQIDNSSINSSEGKIKKSTHITQENDRNFDYFGKNDSSPGVEYKDERKSMYRGIPEWLGDISWAGRHGGWLIEEKRKGGWRVIERGHRHENEGGRSMDVEIGTWIGHMIHTVTKAVIVEESKDLARWKLANRAKKRWIITRGPNNLWQICSAPWETDTSDESEECNESDNTDTADESKSNSESSYSEDISSNGKNEFNKNKSVCTDIHECCSNSTIVSDTNNYSFRIDQSNEDTKHFEGESISHGNSKIHQVLHNRSHSLTVI